MITEGLKKRGFIPVVITATVGKGRVPEAVKQAYCIVVTVNDKDDVHAFKITVTDDPIFQTIKEDQRSRIQDTAITAEALLPDGPYSLWKAGETSRRVKDLAGAFAQMPHLPKMLKAQAISDTLVDGCVQGAFVLRLMRPDRTFRTWWRTRPDEAALSDPALELVLPKAAELTDIEPELLRHGVLPGLWSGEQITVSDVASYFSGTKVVQVPRGGYDEPVQIPKATRAAIEKAVSEAVETNIVWLTSGPASLLGEPIPAGILTDAACLLPPPAAITAAEILPENLTAAWQAGEAAPLSIATALSQKAEAVKPDADAKAAEELVNGVRRTLCGMSLRVRVETQSGDGVGFTTSVESKDTLQQQQVLNRTDLKLGTLKLFDADEPTLKRRRRVELRHLRV